MTPIRRTFLIGLAVFLLFAIYVTVWSPVSPGALERRLRDAVDSALDDRSFNWARVSVDGQVATLQGRYPDEGVHDAAIEAIHGAEWAGGWLAGGITAIVDESIAQAGEAPSQLVAILEAGDLELTGIAPSDAARDDISGLANVLFPARASVRLSVRDNAADAQGWTEAASQLLSALSRLEEGAGRLDGDTIILYGAAANAQQGENALTALGAAPARYEASGWLSTPDGNTGAIATMTDCARLADAAGLLGRLRFNPGSAGLAASAEDTLVHVAAVTQACPVHVLTVSVRPVVAGDADAEALAMARGEAVRGALESHNVDAERVTVSVNADQDQLVIISPQHQGDR